MASIYIIAHSLADGWAGPCKIGMSHDCKNRLQSLRSGNPRPIGLYAAINTGSRPNAAQAETVWHGMPLERPAAAVKPLEVQVGMLVG